MKEVRRISNPKYLDSPRSNPSVSQAMYTCSYKHSVGRDRRNRPKSFIQWSLRSALNHLPLLVHDRSHCHWSQPPAALGLERWPLDQLTLNGCVRGHNQLMSHRRNCWYRWRNILASERENCSHPSLPILWSSSSLACVYCEEEKPAGVCCRLVCWTQR